MPVPPDDASVDVVPAPTRAEVAACAFPSWAPSFSGLVHRHEVLPLPPPFVARLRAGGALFAPKQSGAFPQRSKKDPFTSETLFEDDTSSSSSSEAEDEGGDTAGGGGAGACEFPELEAAAGDAIARLGGAALPKLSWSAPKDAVWLSADGTLRVTSGAEALLVLLASDAAAHDACHAFSACSDAAPADDASPPPEHQLFLVLKAWAPPHKSSEFRCFAANGTLLAACQRHTADHWRHLSDDADAREAVLDALRRFTEVEVATRWGGARCVFDVAVSPRGRVRVIDFNPWGGSTLPLLFTWAELESLAASAAAPPPRPPLAPASSAVAPELRVVCEAAQALRPSMRTAVPMELWDASETSAFAAMAAARRAQAAEAAAEAASEAGEQREPL